MSIIAWALGCLGVAGAAAGAAAAFIPGAAPVMALFAGSALKALQPFGQAALSIAGKAIQNPYVIGAIGAAMLFLTWQHEEAGKSQLRAAATDPATGILWEVESKGNAANLAVYKSSLDTAVTSLKWQTGQVEKWKQTGALKLKASAAAAAALPKALEQGHADRRAIVGADKGPDQLSRHQSIDDAFVNALKEHASQ